MCQPPSTKSHAIGEVRKFTWAEIEKSVPQKATLATVSAQPCYVVIHSKVYDLGGEFVRWHPGGAVAISQIGKDASGAFDVFHKEATHEMLASFYAGDLAENEIRKQTGFEEDIAQLRTTIDQLGLYKSSKMWYLGKALSTLSLAILSVTILALWGRHFIPMVLSAVIMATFFQQSGWLAHDFLHHQVFDNRDFNNYVGLLVGNVWQGFSVAWWKHKHSTHHSVPNVHDQDPDIDTLPFLAWSEHALEGFADFDDTTLTKFLVTYQPVFFFPLLSFARITWAIQSVMWNAPNSEKLDRFPTMTGMEKLGIAIHYSWFFGSAFYLTSPLYAIMWIALSQCVCGLLLAAVFSVNHNGMPIYSKQEAGSMNYYELSIVTGRNVTPSAFNNWFTGGLNYQIEHHMFPTIPRHNLPRLAPLVESLCKKHGVPYHTTGLSRGLGEVLGRLSNIAGQASVIRKK